MRVKLVGAVSKVCGLQRRLCNGVYVCLSDDKRSIVVARAASVAWPSHSCSHFFVTHTAVPPPPPPQAYQPQVAAGVPQHPYMQQPMAPGYQQPPPPVYQAPPPAPPPPQPEPAKELMSEARAQQTEIRVEISKLAGKVDDIGGKVGVAYPITSSPSHPPPHHTLPLPITPSPPTPLTPSPPTPLTPSPLTLSLAPPPLLPADRPPQGGGAGGSGTDEVTRPEP